MTKFLTTLSAIGTVLLCPTLAHTAHAQEVEIEITSESTIQEEPTIQDDDAMNYFASDAKAEEVRATIQSEQIIDGPAVPARELQYLPETLEIDGQGAAKVKMINGRLVTETISAPQAPQAAPNQQVPATSAPAPVTPTGQAYIKPSEAPKTLNAQLKDKNGNAAVQQAVTATPTTPPAVQQQPAQVPVAPAAQPVPVQTAATPAEQTNAASAEPASGDGVGHTAIVDRAQGAKINIISNTDTGVKLGQ